MKISTYLLKRELGMCERRREKLGKERVRIQTAFQAPPVGSRERKATNSYHGSLRGERRNGELHFLQRLQGKKGRKSVV